MTQKRPPIVVVLGHVDHGKTSLLDFLRGSNVQSREAGGITQKISVTKVDSKEGKFTFIDTPGHSAFLKMRQSGAQAADLALLVVAADDGPKPQTLEALKFIRETSLPFIVVLTKTDLPSANVQKVLTELEKEGILFEGRGGNTPYVEVSSKTGAGMDNFLEILNLLSELTGIESDPQKPLNAFVVESNKDKRGVVVLAVIKAGTLKVGDNIQAQNFSARVRGLFDENQKQIKEVSPGNPVLILGFSQMPPTGSEITYSGSTAHTDQPITKTVKIPTIEKGQIAVVIKAPTFGSLEALKSSIPQKAVVIESSVGDVTEGDIFTAKSANAIVLCFESKISSQIKMLAQTENVEIYEFKIIYDLIKKLEELIALSQEKFSGEAEVLAIFPFDNKKIAGCKITKGQFKKGSKVKIMEGEKLIGETKVISLKREKQDIELARVGEECGMLLSPQLDIKVGNVILSVE